MKVYLLVAVLALTACGKKNDVPALHHEAVALVKYYTQPPGTSRLDQLDARVQAIFKRGNSIPGNLPGIEDVGRRLQEARDRIVQLRGIVGAGPDGKSAVEKQADAAAKERNADNLRKLVHDTHVALDEGITVINENLASVESWIANYDRKTLAMNAPAPAQGNEQATPAGAGSAAPPAPPAAGSANQPAPAAAGSANQPAPPPAAAPAPQPTPPKQ